MAIQYTPDYNFVPWVDNVTRVSASGANGFNARQKKLVDELRRIGATFDDVRAALDALGRTPDPKPLTLSLTPAFVSVGTGGGWTTQAGFASFETDAAGNPKATATGLMSVALHNGAILQKIRAIGQFTGAGTLDIVVAQRALAIPAIVTPIGKVSPKGDFSATPTEAICDPSVATVNTSKFTYLVQASAAGLAAGSVLRLVAIQIDYTSA